MHGCRRLPLVNDARGNDPSIMQDAVRVGLFSKGIDETANLANQACKQLEALLSPIGR